MTMTIYHAWPAEGYDLCQPEDEEDWFTIAKASNGQLQKAHLDMKSFRIVSSFRDQRWKRADSPWLGEHAMVFRPKAAEALEAMLTQYGDLIQITANGEPAFIYNVTNLLDALDLKASDIARFPDSGDVMHVRRYEFLPTVIRDSDIFKVSGLRSSPTFLSERFVREWDAHGLTGLVFRNLWSSNDRCDCYGSSNLTQGLNGPDDNGEVLRLTGARPE